MFVNWCTLGNELNPLSPFHVVMSSYLSCLWEESDGDRESQSEAEGTHHHLDRKMEAWPALQEPHPGDHCSNEVLTRGGTLTSRGRP